MTSHHPARLAAMLSLLAAHWGSTALAAVPVVKLNDTGVTFCRDADGVDSTSCSGTGQDGEFGRDASANTNDGADGHAGFSFRKVCNNGGLAGSVNCPADALLGPGAKQWACTKDLRTGLVWEVKTTDGGLRDTTLRYVNEGNGAANDALAYVAAVNKKALCGTKTWRLPTRHELLSLVDYGVAEPGPVIDTTWFPNTFNGYHWTSEGLAGYPNVAWGVGFIGGYGAYNPRDFLGAVRLVRGPAGL